MYKDNVFVYSVVRDAAVVCVCASDEEVNSFLKNSANSPSCYQIERRNAAEIPEILKVENPALYSVIFGDCSTLEVTSIYRGYVEDDIPLVVKIFNDASIFSFSFLSFNVFREIFGDNQAEYLWQKFDGNNNRDFLSFFASLDQENSIKLSRYFLLWQMRRKSKM